MAPTQSQPSKLYACDIARYNDAELDQYLEVNGGDVDVEDSENLPEDFIQRLRVRTGAINPYDLTARLQHITADRQARPRPPSLASDYRSRETTESLDEEEDYRRDIRKETEYCNTLINEGGRPSHPLSLGSAILEDPGDYREILRYWQLVNGDSEGRKWQVFRSQMGNWRHFCRWQRKNREDGRFLEYAKGVKQGLAEHGFTRLFQLDEDPERQDKLTTWIEYLDFEYWWYDDDIRFVKQHQPRYEKAWKKLVDSQVLRPFETEAYICDIKSAFQRAGERENAEKVVDTAKLAVLSVEKAITDSRRSSLSKTKAQQQFAAAESKLHAATKTLESIKRRNDLVNEFHKMIGQPKVVNNRVIESYLTRKKDAECRTILLRWILQQVPLVELEMKLAKVADNDSVRGNTRVQRRSKRNYTDESNEDEAPKRQRRNGVISGRKTRAFIAKECEHENRLKSSGHDILNEGRASKRPERIGQNPDVTDPTPIREPVAIQPLSALSSSSQRRSTRITKPPNRFQ